jgi:Zn-finger nucleic acid-binding protein
MIFSLHCPNCGAAADPDARRCPYCQARLATVSCPSCFALMFDGTAFCPKCGARRARVESDAEGGARCPACRRPLHRVDLGSTAVLECAACDGVWIDAEAFEQLCGNRESQAAVLHGLQRPSLERTQTRVQYRPCLRCGKMMNRVNFGRLSGAVVDVCRGHGTFLDAGELHQIVTFIQGGGLERARARKLDEIKDEERRLKELQTKAMYEHRPSGGTPWNGADLLSLISLISGRE